MNMACKIVLIVPLLFFAVIKGNAQTVPGTHVLNNEGIVVQADPELGKMIERHIDQNRKRGGINGYRIQLYFNSGPKAREEANNLKASVLSKYPDEPVYIIFQSPFYKVRVGDFRTKADALGVFYALKKKYPGAYIVKDIIRFPSLDEEK